MGRTGRTKELTIKTDHGGNGFTESLVFSEVRLECLTLSGGSPEASNDKQGDKHEDTTDRSVIVFDMGVEGLTYRSIVVFDQIAQQQRRMR
jgi:hypothetical protein